MHQAGIPRSYPSRNFPISQLERQFSFEAVNLCQTCAFDVFFLDTNELLKSRLCDCGTSVCPAESVDAANPVLGTRFLGFPVVDTQSLLLGVQPARMLNFCSWKSDFRKMSFSSTGTSSIWKCWPSQHKQQDEENNETRGPLPIGQLAILGMNQCQTKRTTLATPPASGQNDLEPKWLSIKKIHPCCPLIPGGVHVRPCCRTWWCNLYGFEVGSWTC